MALFTFATDDPTEARKIVEALFGDPRQHELPAPVEPAKPARGRATKADTTAANDAAPERPAPPADTVVVTQHAPPVSAAPVVPPAAPPVAVVPPVQPAAPPPAPVPQPVGEAQPGWTVDHVISQAAAFLTSPKGGPERLKPLFEKYGIARARDCQPQNFHLLYADMAGILEAA
jgi:hypothetical protein